MKAKKRKGKDENPSQIPARIPSIRSPPQMQRFRVLARGSQNNIILFSSLRGYLTGEAKRSVLKAFVTWFLVFLFFNILIILPFLPPSLSLTAAYIDNCRAAAWFSIYFSPSLRIFFLKSSIGLQLLLLLLPHPPPSSAPQQ